MQYEFKVAWAAAAGLAFVIGLVLLSRHPFSIAIVGIVFTALGGFLVSFGFWGADFAFDSFVLVGGTCIPAYVKGSFCKRHAL